MIQIVGPQFTQWDTGRSVSITDSDATHIHFANQGDSKAVIMELSESKAKIPDYLFQTGKQICVYAVKDGITIESKVFFVNKREKPEDYIYEEDQRNFVYELIADAQEATEAAKQAAKEATDVSNTIKEDAASGKFKGEKGDPGEQGPKGDPGTALIDNNVVGDSAWSSKNTVDKLCPGFTESGAVAVCDPVEGYPLDVISEIAEKDDGSAWNSISLTQCGKNFFSGDREITFTRRKDITLEKPIPPGTYFLSLGRYTGSGKIKPVIVPKYEDGSDAPYLQVLYYNNGKGVIFTKPVTSVQFWSNGYSNSDSTGVRCTLYDIQIEPGTAKTAYDEYKAGMELTVNFANLGVWAPVHFGSYNWRTGVLDTEENGVFQHDPEKGTFTEIEDLSAYVPPIVRNIPAMSGTNCFYSNCGNTAVKGKSDPVKIIEKLTTAILAIGGTQ